MFIAGERLCHGAIRNSQQVDKALYPPRRGSIG